MSVMRGFKILRLVVGCDIIGEYGQFKIAILEVRSVQVTQLSLLRSEQLRSEAAPTIC